MGESGCTSWQEASGGTFKISRSCVAVLRVALGISCKIPSTVGDGDLTFERSKFIPDSPQQRKKLFSLGEHDKGVSSCINQKNLTTT